MNVWKIDSEFKRFYEKPEVGPSVISRHSDGACLIDVPESPDPLMPGSVNCVPLLIDASLNYLIGQPCLIVTGSIDYPQVQVTPSEMRNQIDQSATVAVTSERGEKRTSEVFEETELDSLVTDLLSGKKIKVDDGNLVDELLSLKTFETQFNLVSDESVVDDPLSVKTIDTSETQFDENTVDDPVAVTSIETSETQSADRDAVPFSLSGTEYPSVDEDVRHMVDMISCPNGLHSLLEDIDCSSNFFNAPLFPEFFEDSSLSYVPSSSSSSTSSSTVSLPTNNPNIVRNP